MNEVEMKNLIAQTVEEVSARTAELNQYKSECDTKVAEANAKVEAITAEKNEAVANAENIQAALDTCISEKNEACQKVEALEKEVQDLKDELNKVQSEKRVGEMNAAIAGFSDEEKAYAQAEIDAFNADPMASEINSVVSKIYEGIGMKSKKDEAIAAEKNSAAVEDIFGEVGSTTASEEVNIF